MASFVRRGKRGNTLSPILSSRSEDGPNSQFSEQPNVFKLQLRPLEDSESFKPSVQLVACEFATRYLESVGVRPSKATMELVHRNVPLAETHIKTTLRAKGHVEDEIHISVPPVTHHYRVPVFINPAAVLQLGIGNSVLGADGDAGQEGSRTDRTSSAASAGPRTDPASGSKAGDAGRASAPGGAGAHGRGPGGTDFLDMAARYLHPFNLDVNLARQNVAALYAAARPRTASDGGGTDTRTTGGGAAAAVVRDGSNEGGSAGRPSTSGRGGRAEGSEQLGPSASGRTAGGGAGRRAGSWPRSNNGTLRGSVAPQAAGGGDDGSTLTEVARMEILDELVQPLLVTPEVVLTLQAQLEAALADWHRHQAPEALKGRLTAEEFSRTQEELSSEGMVKLLITLTNFLHEEMIRGHPSYPAHLEARLASRDGLRSGQSRRQESLLDERRLLQRGSSIGNDSAASAGQRNTGGSAAGLRGGVQLPTNISIQQMTNLQKYDLGYQAYVRQKLEQRHAAEAAAAAAAHGSGRGSPQSRGGGHRSRAGATSPPRTGGGNSDRSPPRHAHAQHADAHNSHHARQPTLAEDAAGDAQRVSFAVAQHYTPPPAPDGKPDSASGRGSLLGPLNLPGAPAARSAAASPAHSHHHPNPHRGSSSHSLSAAAAAAGGGAGGASPLHAHAHAPPSPIPGLPPRVDRALRASPSFALAAAANTARSIHASLNAADSAALQRERLFALHVDFAGRFKALRQSRSGMFFALPILLLAMRLCVNTLFATLYPLWTRTAEGAQVLADMDAAVRSLFDPHGYLERALSVLQSTPSAIEAVTRHPQRRGNERQHFNDTSALVQATLRGARSAGARKLMQSSANQSQGSGLLRTQLTHEQRATLFKLGLQWMQQPDPVLSQIGEPQAVGRL